jgi:Family of unknown function (DUF6339)
VKLHRLSAFAHHLVTRELASGQLARHLEASYQPFLEEPDQPLEVDAAAEAVAQVIADTERYDVAIDRVAAPLLHRALPITRREAAQPGVWRFLAVVACPELVRHRWGDPSWTTTRSHYWSPGTRPDSNTFSRLWWIAELTRDGASYALTDEIFARPPLAKAIFVRKFGSYRPAVAAFTRVMKSATPTEIDRVARELHGRLSTLVLEALDEEQLSSLIEELFWSR